jgi:hypothetical protein
MLRRTFDNQGLGDDALPAGTTAASVDTPDPLSSIGTPANPLQLPTMTVSVPATQIGFSLASLLQPPFVYWLVGAGVLAAWYYNGKRR